jgi:chemotaxis protein histidine kinase CheA
METDQALLGIFKKEANGLIVKMKVELDAMESYICDTGESISFNLACDSFFRELYRCAHTLKGASYSTGYGPLGELSKVLSEVFKAVRDQKIELQSKDVPLLKEAVDECRSLFVNPGSAVPDLLINRLNAMLGQYHRQDHINETHEN